MSSEQWAEETVPDDAILYVRVHDQCINKRGPEKGLPNEGAFYNTPKDKGTDLSSDWNKYSDPQKSREHIGREYKTNTTDFKAPSKFYIVSFLVNDIKGLDLNQDILHTPRQDNFPQELEGSPWNRAHCSIFGDDEERRVRMKDIAKWEIAPNEYNIDQEMRIFQH